VAPLAVQFDATGAGSGVVQPTGADPDFATFGYLWTYGEPAPADWTGLPGKSRNQSTGWIGAHVFEAAGTYRVTLKVTNVAGVVADYHQDIVVTDPATVFAARTFHVAANGNDSNPGTQAQPFLTLTRGFAAAFSGNQVARLLFRRGDSFTSPILQTLSSGTAATLVSAYGTGARPVLRFQANDGGMNLSARGDVRFTDVDIVPQAPAMLSYARGITLGNDTTLLRCRIDGFGYNLDANYVNRVTVQDCEILNGVEYGLWGYSANLQLGNHLAVMGNRFDQAGYHLTRVYINRSLFLANRYERGGFTAMAWVGRDAGQPPTQLNCIVDNSYTTETLDVVAMGPANAQFNEYARGYLFEGNRFYSRAASGSCLRIRGSRVAIRNNVFDVTGRQAVQIGPWTGSPVPAPSDVSVEHNTSYRGAGAPLVFLTALSTNPTVVRNNLMFCAQGVASAPTGSVTLFQNLTANPLFVSPATGDFHLGAGSPAIGTGVATGVRTDFYRAARTSPADVGAVRSN
ncbi:MAG: hypothetical protein WAT39_11795, partial [Planctomycetota bacterium]